jgi:hypothetical protein
MITLSKPPDFLCSLAGAIDGIQRIAREEGPLTLYRGFSSEIYKGSLQNFIYFFRFESLWDAVSVFSGRVFTSSATPPSRRWQCSLRTRRRISGFAQYAQRASFAHCMLLAAFTKTWLWAFLPAA